MYAARNDWELLILDANPGVSSLGCLTVGDLDDDGNVEVVTGGGGGLLWYRPATFAGGLYRRGHGGLVREPRRSAQRAVAGAACTSTNAPTREVAPGTATRSTTASSTTMGRKSSNWRRGGWAL